MTTDSKKATIGLRATATEREAWERAARRDGRTLSAWIVRRCNGEPTTAPVSRTQPAVEANEPQSVEAATTIDAPVSAQSGDRS
jgi:uncharacterized protein (DUF1778 family)